MPYNRKEKYVGPQDKWYQFLIPRRPFWVDFNTAAYSHDQAYMNGEDKLKADLEFLRDCMYQVEKKKWKYLPNSIMRQLARLTALLYFACVRDFGKYHFST